MYQAGIKKITLYENKGISFVFYDAGDSSKITDLSNSGEVITLENLNRPEFDIKVMLSNSGFVLNEYTLNFLFFGLTLVNFNQLFKLKTSVYGWCVLVEFYDGTIKFYNTPLFCKKSDIKPHEEMSFTVELETAVPTPVSHYNYLADVFLPIYRADTTLLTADTTIYTADYAL